MGTHPHTACFIHYTIYKNTVLKRNLFIPSGYAEICGLLTDAEKEHSELDLSALQVRYLSMQNLSLLILLQSVQDF